MRRAPPRYAPLCLLWRVACLLIVGCGSSNSLSPVTQEQGVSACLTFASCVPGDGVHGCFTQQLSLFSTEEVRCLAAAGGDCGKASLCVGVSVSPAPADGGCSPSCDGPRLARCAENFRYQTSCSRWAAADATCLSTSLGAGCAIGSCPQTRAYCDGTRRIVCDSGLLVVHDCRLEGALTCGSTGSDGTPAKPC